MRIHIFKKKNLILNLVNLDLNITKKCTQIEELNLVYGGPFIQIVNLYKLLDQIYQLEISVCEKTMNQKWNKLKV